MVSIDRCIKQCTYLTEILLLELALLYSCKKEHTELKKLLLKVYKEEEVRNLRLDWRKPDLPVCNSEKAKSPFLLGTKATL